MSAATAPAARGWRAALYAALALWLLLNLLSLDRYPLANCDEAFWSEAAYNLLSEGQIKLDSMQGYGQTDLSVTAASRIVSALIAVSQALLGVSLWSSRLPALIGALLTALALYALGRDLYGQGVGLAAALFYLFSWRVLLQSHLGRPESWLTLAAVLLCWLLLRTASRAAPLDAFLAGLLAALSVDLHFAGIALAFSAGLIVLGEGLWRRQWRLILSFAGGGVLGLIFWLWAHVTGPGIDLFRYQTFELYQRAGITGLTLPQAMYGLRDLPFYYWREFGPGGGWQNLVQLPLMLFGLGFLLVDRRPEARRLLAFFVLATLLHASLVPLRSWYGALIWLPFLLLMTAAALAWLGGRLAAWAPLARLPRPLIEWGPSAALALIYLAGSLVLMARYRSASLDEYDQALLGELPAGSTLLAAHAFWYARPDSEEAFTSTMVAAWTLYEGRDFDEAAARDLLADLAPAYVAALPQWQCFEQPSAEYPVIEPLLEAQCERVQSVDAGLYPAADLYYCPAMP